MEKGVKEDGRATPEYAAPLFPGERALRGARDEMKSPETPKHELFLAATFVYAVNMHSSTQRPLKQGPVTGCKLLQIALKANGARRVRVARYGFRK